MIVAGIAAYQEARHIATVVSQCRHYVDRVVVVDDGSEDETGFLAREAGAWLITNRENKGHGYCENMLFIWFAHNMQRDDVLVTLDADEQHFPRDIPVMVGKLKEGYDVVNGSRLYDKRLPGPTPYRRVLNGMATYIVRALSDWYPITDSQSGFRAYRYWVVKRLRLKINRYAWSSESFIHLAHMKAKLGEVRVGTVWTPPSGGLKHATLSYGIRVLVTLILIRLRHLEDH